MRAGADEPGQRDWILDALDARHRAHIQRLAVHHTGVHLRAPVAGQHAARACVEAGIILQRHDRRLDGVHRRSTAQENLPARLRRRIASFAR